MDDLLNVLLLIWVVFVGFCVLGVVLWVFFFFSVDNEFRNGVFRNCRIRRTVPEHPIPKLIINVLGVIRGGNLGETNKNEK